MLSKSTNFLKFYSCISPSLRQKDQNILPNTWILNLGIVFSSFKIINKNTHKTSSQNLFTWEKNRECLLFLLQKNVPQFCKQKGTIWIGPFEPFGLKELPQPQLGCQQLERNYDVPKEGLHTSYHRLFCACTSSVLPSTSGELTFWPCQISL